MEENTQDHITLMGDIMRKVTAELTQKLNDIVTEGLKRKGYEFENTLQLTDFIKEHCRCEDFVESKTKLYFVKEKPFLIYDYNYKQELSTIIPKDSLQDYAFTAKMGSYSYL